MGKLAYDDARHKPSDTVLSDNLSGIPTGCLQKE